MRPDQRIEILKEFIERQRYLIGLKYRVHLDEVTDRVSIEFKDINEPQLHNFKMALASHMMAHVGVTYQALQPPKQTRSSRHRNRNRHGGGPNNQRVK